MPWNSTGQSIRGPAGPQGATGSQGPAGPQGQAGPGLPVGGSAGHYPRKASNTNYDIEWAHPALLLADAKPIFSAVQSVAQSLATGVTAGLTFSAEIVDTHNGHSTTVNTSRYVVPTGWGGWWRLSAVVLVNNTGTGRVGGCFLRNGAIVPGSWTQAPSPSGQDGSVALTRLVQLAVGDYVELGAYQASGAARNTVVAAPYQSAFDVEFVRPV